MSNNNLKNCNNNYVSFKKDDLSNEIKVISIGELITYKEISEGVFSFLFNFDFENNEHLNKKYKLDANCTRGLVFNLIIGCLDGKAGFGGIEVFALVEEHKLSVDIDNNLVEEALDTILNTLFGENKSTIAFLIDKLITDNEKLLTTKEIEKEDNNKNVVSLNTISNYMYELIKNSDNYLDENIWYNLSDEDKEDMVRELELELDSFIDLMNHFELKFTDRCSDNTINTVLNIINKKLRELEIEKEHNHTLEDDTIDTLKELKLELDNLGIAYVLYKNVDDVNSGDMISIFDRNKKECLWISKCDEGYQLFDSVECTDIRCARVLEKSKRTCFNNLCAVLDIITKIVKTSPSINEIVETANSDDTNQVETNNCNNVDLNSTTEDITDVDKDRIKDIKLDNKKVKTKKEFRREFILNHLDELSDEDLLNELKRRMNSK